MSSNRPFSPASCCWIVVAGCSSTTTIRPCRFFRCSSAWWAALLAVHWSRCLWLWASCCSDCRDYCRPGRVRSQSAVLAVSWSDDVVRAAVECFPRWCRASLKRKRRGWVSIIISSTHIVRRKSALAICKPSSKFWSVGLPTHSTDASIAQ